MKAPVAVGLVAVLAILLVLNWQSQPAVIETAPLPAPPPTSLAAGLLFSVEIQAPDRKTTRVSGEQPLGQVSAFRFLLTPVVAGRLAVIGPDTRNVPTLFRSASGGPLAPGSPVQFPDTWFGVTGETASEAFTFVFVPDGAVVPGFAAGSAQRRLTVEEQKDLLLFREKFIVAPEFASDAASGVLTLRDSGQPIAADLTIRY